MHSFAKGEYAPIKAALNNFVHSTRMNAQNNVWLCVIGTRPEAIKMAPVVRAAQAAQRNVHVLLTGQHGDMVHNVLQAFDITPHTVLHTMQPQQSLAQLTANILQQVAQVIAQLQPQWVLVQGDTASAVASAWAAFLHHVPVAHIEAGLRTHNMQAPWPEEMNRVVLARLAQRHFAPTALAADNLRREGVANDHITITGNTAIDALLYASALPCAVAPLLQPDKKMILVTGHRRENFDHGLHAMVQTLIALAQKPDVHIVWPVHPNPVVQQAVAPLMQLPQVSLIKPVSYVPFVHLMQQAWCIITDSGGIQEEAPALGKPVFVTRSQTERPEALAGGSNQLVGTCGHALLQAVERIYNNSAAYAAMSQISYPYGDGRAAQVIVEALGLVHAHIS